MSVQRQYGISRTGLAAVGLLAAVLTFSGCTHWGSPGMRGHHHKDRCAYPAGSPPDSYVFDGAQQPDEPPIGGESA
jgi:hypothetical protein